MEKEHYLLDILFFETGNVKLDTKCCETGILTLLGSSVDRTCRDLQW